MTELSIIIVSFNARDDLARCLESLHAQISPLRREIVVLDNASRDGSAQMVRDRWPLVTIIDTGANLGFARASNIGIRRSAGTFLLLLNSDTIVPPGAIERLVEELTERPEAAAAGPRVVDAEGRVELSFGRMIGPARALTQKLTAWLYRRGPRIVRRAIERRTRQPHVVDWVTGACLLVRREDAEAVGLLDERFFMYCEDVDFCAALRQRGREVRFVPDAEIVHARGRSAATAARETERAYRQSQLAFYAKHHPRWLLWLRAYLKLKGKLPV